MDGDPAPCRSLEILYKGGDIVPTPKGCHLMVEDTHQTNRRSELREVNRHNEYGFWVWGVGHSVLVRGVREDCPVYVPFLFQTRRWCYELNCVLPHFPSVCAEVLIPKTSQSDIIWKLRGCWLWM